MLQNKIFTALYFCQNRIKMQYDELNIQSWFTFNLNQMQQLPQIKNSGIYCCLSS